MNPIDFFEQQVAKWNEDEKCGFCFSFSAPLVESAINIQQIRKDEECCVQVMITDVGFQNNFTRNATTRLLTEEICDHTFTLFVLAPDSLGINNYNEIANHSVEESKWKRILQPLQDCFGCGLILDFCDFWQFPVEVTQWRGTSLLNYQDNNYSGWKINATFRIRK